MNINTAYRVKIKHYNRILDETVRIYRNVTDYCINVCLNEWNSLIAVAGARTRQMSVEHMLHATRKNPLPKYSDFDRRFYKLPSYLRRSAIAEAIGCVSSYKTRLAAWECEDAKSRGRRPRLTAYGNAWPCLYKGNMFVRTGQYTARIKVYIRNTWDWLDIDLKRSDADYILHHCAGRRECPPVLLKRGKEWFLVFPFEEEVKLSDSPVGEQTILAVDLGINSAATAAVMNAEGAVLGRRFLKLPREEDSLAHAIGRIKKAQQHGARRMPRLWAKADGINADIASKTAAFIIDTAVLYDVDVIVFEYLDLAGKKHGSSKRQRLHLWKADAVQRIVADKAHRLGMHISHICAWNTSHLAFDGSGCVLRGREAGTSYSVCRFQSGKTYNADLNAAYNIGARYFIREIIKSLPATARLSIEAEVPRCLKRSTCTSADLIDLCAVLRSFGIDPLSLGRTDGDAVRCA